MNHRVVQLWTLIVFLGAAACAPVPEGDPPGEDAGPETTSVTLTVVDVFNDDAPMGAVSVTLYGGDAELAAATTDADGEVTFAGLVPVDTGFVATVHGGGATVATQFGLVGDESKTIPVAHRNLSARTLLPMTVTGGAASLSLYEELS